MQHARLRALHAKGEPAHAHTGHGAGHALGRNTWAAEGSSRDEDARGSRFPSPSPAPPPPAGKSSVLLRGIGMAIGGPRTVHCNAHHWHT